MSSSTIPPDGIAPPNPEDGDGKPGRPPKCTQAVIDAAAILLSAGNFRCDVAMALGIGMTTFKRWMASGKRFPEGLYGRFRAVVLRAEGLFKTRAVASITASGESDDPRLLLEFLARKYPRQFGVYRGELGELKRRLKLAKLPTEGDLANLLTGRSDCGKSPAPKECVVPASPLAIAEIYDRLGIERVGIGEALTLVNLLSELMYGRPVEVGYEWYAGGGHVAIIRGFSKQMGAFYVSDPWFGENNLTYQEVLGGYGVGRWTLTFGRFALRA